MATDNEILDFWAWFASVADKLGDDFMDNPLQEALDARLGCLGEVGWELGPGSTAECALAISPDGDPDVLPLTLRIVALAPALSRWEFHPARPARAENLEFSIETSPGGELSIDARSWRYVLFEFPHGTFDIVVEQENLADVSDDDRYTAAVVLLDALLGEGTRLLRIRDVEPLPALNPAQGKKANPISLLPEHLASRC